MTAESFVTIACSIVGTLGVVIAAMRWFIRVEIQPVAQKVANVAEKTEVLWKFTFRRAVAEAVDRNHASIKEHAADTPGLTVSDLATPSKVRMWYQSIAPDLQAFYKTLSKPITDEDLFILIEKHFGDRLLREICIPCSMHMGACVLIAAQLAKE